MFIINQWLWAVLLVLTLLTPFVCTNINLSLYDLVGPMIMYMLHYVSEYSSHVHIFTIHLFKDSLL